ncbi:MAG: hypothetical protein WCK31_04470, partial [bacterium]
MYSNNSFQSQTFDPISKMSHLYSLFKSKNAFSPESSVEITKDDCLTLGIPYPAIFKGSKIVNLVGENKYWFSIEEYTKYINQIYKERKIVIIFGIVIMILLLAFVIYIIY